MKARTPRAVLHRLNRDRRAVIAVAAAIRLLFRCLPPILWDHEGRAYRLNRRAEMVVAAAAMVRAGLYRMCGWAAPRTVSALFREPELRVCQHDD